MNKQVCVHCTILEYLYMCYRLKFELYSRMVEHIWEPLPNYITANLLLVGWKHSTYCRHRFRNVSFIFECNLRNCQRLSNKDFQSKPTGNKDSAKENAPKLWRAEQNYHTSLINWTSSISFYSTAQKMTTTTAHQILIQKV